MYEDILGKKEKKKEIKSSSNTGSKKSTDEELKKYFIKINKKGEIKEVERIRD